MVLPLPGRPHHQQVVPARRCDLERAPRRGLAAHVRQVEVARRKFRLELGAYDFGQSAFAQQVRDQHRQRLSPKDRDARGQAGLGGIAGGHDRERQPARPRAIELRQNPAHRPQTAVE